MARPTNKHISLVQQEENNKLRNELRQLFWKDVQGMFMMLREMLELRKQEKEGKLADNKELDYILETKYLEFCQSILPFMAPYLKEMAMLNLEKIQKQLLSSALDDMPTPTDKTKLN